MYTLLSQDKKRLLITESFDLYIAYSERRKKYVLVCLNDRGKHPMGAYSSKKHIEDIISEVRSKVFEGHKDFSFPVEVQYSDGSTRLTYLTKTVDLSLDPVDLTDTVDFISEVKEEE